MLIRPSRHGPLMPTSRAKMPIRVPVIPIRLSSDRAPDGPTSGAMHKP
jgi:hypothetical protein